jgi:hypothetical protein
MLPPCQNEPSTARQTLSALDEKFGQLTGLRSVLSFAKRANGHDVAVKCFGCFVLFRRHVASAIWNPRSIVEDHHHNRILGANATLLHCW